MGATISQHEVTNNSRPLRRFSVRSEGYRPSPSRSHNPKVVGSNPAPATTSAQTASWPSRRLFSFARSRISARRSGPVEGSGRTVNSPSRCLAISALAWAGSFPRSASRRSSLACIHAGCTVGGADGVASRPASSGAESRSSTQARPWPARHHSPAARAATASICTPTCGCPPTIGSGWSISAHPLAQDRLRLQADGRLAVTAEDGLA